MNMHMILDWVKHNVFILVFVVIMVAALVALPIVSKGLNEKVAKDVKTRGGKVAELARLEKTSFFPPAAGPGGEAQQLLINEALLNRYEKVTEALQHDATEVINAAIAYNKQGRELLLQDVDALGFERVEIGEPVVLYQ